MDFTSIIGLIAGAALVVLGIMKDGMLSSFYDPASIMITIGGTVAAMITSCPLSMFKEVPRQLAIVVQRQRYSPRKYIDKIVDYAQDARKKGLLALEDRANQEKDPFFKSSIMLIVDSVEPAKTREILENELNCLEVRHQKGWAFYEKMATYAPAYGMIGTLIGLVNMLKNLDLSAEGAADSLASGMSVALITTFYGSMLANWMLMPIASKLKARHDEEMLCKELIVEGVLAVQSGSNPRNIEERLMAYLKNSERGPKNEGKSGGKEKVRRPAKGER